MVWRLFSSLLIFQVLLWVRWGIFSHFVFLRFLLFPMLLIHSAFQFCSHVLLQMFPYHPVVGMCCCIHPIFFSLLWSVLFCLYYFILSRYHFSIPTFVSTVWCYFSLFVPCSSVLPLILSFSCQLESTLKQVCARLNDSSQYSRWYYQCCGLDRFDSSSDFQSFQSFFPALWGPFQAQQLKLVSPWPTCSNVCFVLWQDPSISLSFCFLIFFLPAHWPSG